MPSEKGSPTGQVIALTGATGFLGGHVLNALVTAGYQIKALTRKRQPSTPNVEWVHGALSEQESLLNLCEGADVLIHLAGLTKALNRDAFFDVNVAGSLSLFDCAAAQNIKQVIHISSLAAREPRLSHYGASKAGTELLLTARKWPFSWTILRPPAIYGPGDKEILKLLKATKFGILPAPGNKNNRFSMIHAADLAAAIVALIEEPHRAQILEIDDGKSRGYQLKDVAEALTFDGKKTPKVFSLPFAILGTVGVINGMMANAIHRPAMLTLSTARYLCHPDWTVRQQLLPKLKLWKPHFDLKAGLSNTIDWYKKNGLL
ncbi:NAD-dependent epimerase/dehydratase family protein [Kordiimonas pumila]|uniref:NAD-dependent epimerase/dehydratase family protein n=1 Tax=Kordiimonas pumila TaxID=2161677 RepID=A0ABV7D2V1_9PROT|nr:NAD(P)-dependent oxidoreductase [Kordiimonas pumila]